MPITTVKIGGVAVACPRPVRIVSFDTVKRGGIRGAVFQVRGGKLPTLPDPYSGKTFEVFIDEGSGPVRKFSGDVVGLVPSPEDGIGWVRTYQALSLENRAEWFPHTDSNSGLDNSTYNASVDNQPTDFILSRSGRTVGQILTSVLTMPANAAALHAAGLGALTLSGSTWSLPADTVADLAALAVIPPASVYFGGQQFWGALVSFCSTWAPNVLPTVRPSDGAFRFLDQRSFAAHTLTMGSDPIHPTPLRRDVADCFQRVTVRGQPIAELFCFQTAGPNNSHLSESPFAHDGLTVAQAKAAWKKSDYQNPTQASGQATASATVSGGAVTIVAQGTPGTGYVSGTHYTLAFSGGGGSGAAGYGVGQSDGSVSGYTVTAGGSGYTSAPTVSVPSPLGTNSDTGTCNCTDTLTVVLTSTNKSLTYGSNYWNYSSTGREGVIYLSWAAGTDITTFAQRQTVSNTALSPGGTATFTLDRALPHTNFDGYRLAGQAKGASDVWRRYALPSWAQPVMTQQSSYPGAVNLASNTSATLTSSAFGIVEWVDSFGGTNQAGAGITVDSSNGTVLFAYPTYLTAGGVPSNVVAWVPIQVSANVATSPADTVSGGVSTPNYAGTSHTQDGLSKTLTITCPAWRDPGNTTAMLAYAADVLDSVKDAVIEGECEFLGYYSPAMDAGIALNIAGSGYATGWESSALPAVPVVEATLEYAPRGLMYRTVMHCSNRRQAFGAEAFARPDRSGVTFDFGGDDVNIYERGADGQHDDGSAGLHYLAVGGPGGDRGEDLGQLRDDQGGDDAGGDAGFDRGPDLNPDVNEQGQAPE